MIHAIGSAHTVENCTSRLIWLWLQMHYVNYFLRISGGMISIVRL